MKGLQTAAIELQEVMEADMPDPDALEQAIVRAQLNGWG